MVWFLIGVCADMNQHFVPKKCKTSEKYTQTKKLFFIHSSQVMKTFKRLLLQHLRPLVSDCLDPLWFAYQADISGEDAIIYLLHKVYTHLERPQSSVRIMLFDFYEAFDTGQPFQLVEKLSVMQVDQNLVTWTTNYLTDRVC